MSLRASAHIGVAIPQEEGKPYVFSSKKLWVAAERQRPPRNDNLFYSAFSKGKEIPMKEYEVLTLTKSSLFLPVIFN